MKQWNSLGRKKQNQILVLLTFGVVAIYLLGWHWQNYKALEFSENMVSRAENRLELKEKSIPKMPEAAGTYLKKIDEQTKKENELELEYNQISTLFMPLDNVQSYQALRLSISSLAEENHVRIESVNEVNKGAQTVAGNAKFLISKKWGRPLLKYHLHLRYFDLLNFIDELDSLDFQVSVVNIEVEAELVDEATIDVSADQNLAVVLVLAL
ncbi:hypothetical protein JCM30760_22190 [Thiomicrorhabdus hydrogeniphila]